MLLTALARASGRTEHGPPAPRCYYGGRSVGGLETSMRAGVKTRAGDEEDLYAWTREQPDASF
jgi:hypothetical protein